MGCYQVLTYGKVHMYPHTLLGYVRSEATTHVLFVACGITVTFAFEAQQSRQ